MTLNSGVRLPRPSFKYKCCPRATKSAALESPTSRASSAFDNLTALRLCSRAHSAASIAVETAVWKRVHRSIDAYAQRMSTKASEAPCVEYRAISVVLPAALRRFKAKCVEDEGSKCESAGGEDEK